MNLLAAYKRRRNVRITVVFDRKSGAAEEGKQYCLHDGVNVIFSAPFQEADEIICGIVEDAESPRNILVGSSDRAGVSKYCRKVGAEVVSSLDFFSFLEKHRAGSRKALSCDEDGDAKPIPHEADTEYYLDRFTKPDDT